MKNIFGKVVSYSIYFLVFLFPVFFLNTTQEYYLTNKFYLVGYGVLIVLSFIVIDFLINKKLGWKRSSFDNVVLLFLFSNLITLVLMVTNKVDSLLYSTTGLAMITFLSIFYFIISNFLQHKERKGLLNILNLSNIILSVLAIVFFFNPLKNVNVPTSLQFLKMSTFTPVGSQLDLMIYVGFFTVLLIGNLLSRSTHSGEKKPLSKEAFNLVSIFLSVIALSLTGYSLFKAGFSLPPFSVTWYSAIETLKYPLTMFFGVGAGNFVNVFTQVKPIAYNQSTYWSVNFNQGSSFVLQLWTELGLLGLFAFASMLYMIFKKAYRNFKVDKAEKGMYFVSIYLILVFLFLPVSIAAIFLLFIMLTQFTEDELDVDFHFDTARILPIYFACVILAVAFIGSTGFFLSKAYLAEYYYKKSFDAYVTNKVSDLYENQRLAVITNEYSEKYRLAFSQANLLVANQLASKKPADLTDADRQTITQAIQSAITEAKAAAAIDPGKASNWENLAVIYRNILNVAQGADAWTISAYQRAIIADPNNPALRLNLGGVYFSLKNYDEAINLFTQSINLKPDWPNAHYNLAHAFFLKLEYQKAASEMQNTLTLLDPKSEDFKKAQQELDEFKKMIPAAAEGANSGEQKIVPKELSLPTQSQATVSPKIQLPPTASPDAK
jgi:tetratricopeptide (TPR) repeat protein